MTITQHRLQMQIARLRRLEWHLLTSAPPGESPSSEERFGGLTLSEVAERLHTLTGAQSVPPEFIGD